MRSTRPSSPSWATTRSPLRVAACDPVRFIRLKRRRRAWPRSGRVPASRWVLVRISGLGVRPRTSELHTRGMGPRAISMRWWLALTFAGIAALTAIAVAQVFSARSESAIRERASELTAGSVVTAGLEISDATTLAEVRSRARELGDARRLAL